MKSQTVEAENEKQAQILRKQQPNAPVPDVSSSVPQPAVAGSASAAVPPLGEQTSSPRPASPTLEEHVHDLRRQVQRLVKAPGAPLQSAPFHTATTLRSLPAGTEVLIVISTPYWFGVETHEGQHGWILREQLEQLP